MAKQKKIILASKLTRASVIYLSILSFFGYDVRYLYYPNYLKKKGATWEGIEALLESRGLHKIDFGTLNGIDQYGSLKHGPEYAKVIYEMLFDDVDLKSLSHLFNNLEDSTVKLRILFYDLILSRVMESADMLSVAMALNEEGHHVRIFFPTDGIQKYIFSESVSKFLNIYPKFFNLGFVIKKGTVSSFRLFSGVHERALKLITNRWINVAEAPVVEPSIENSKKKVAYFPHQGVAYGNLFLKDHFYDDDPSSSFFPDKILHIELHAAPGKESIKYYKDHNIDFTVMGLGLQLNKSTVVAIYNACKPIWHSTKNVVGKSKRIASSFIALRGYILFLRAWQNTTSLDGVKIALIGYDYLFPTNLSLALQARGIKTVAVQERFIHVFDNFFHPMFDVYFISGAGVSERLAQNPFHWVGETAEVGLIRSKILKEYTDESKAPTQKEVLILDFHTNPNRLDDEFNPLFCWKSNRDFYENILRLAHLYPEVKFTIRGKNDDWCSISYFANIMAEISELSNINVNREYNELYVSYKLAANADLIIARQTSLGDEAMASGIPVIFYDWTQVQRNNVIDICHYNNAPVYAQSFKDLEMRVQEILFDGKYMDKNQFEQLREFLFSSSIAKPKKKIRDELFKILKS